MIFCKHVHVGCMAKSDLKINDNKIEFSFIIPRSQPLHTRASFEYRKKHVMPITVQGFSPFLSQTP